MARKSYERANFYAQGGLQANRTGINAELKSVVMACGFVSMVGLVSLVAGGVDGLPVYAAAGVAICSGIALIFWGENGQKQ